MIKKPITFSPSIAFAIGLALWAVLSLLLFPTLSKRLDLSGDFANHVLVKAVLLVAVGLLIVIDSRPLDAFGFRRAREGAQWRGLGALALLFGVLSTTAILLSPAQGMQSLRGLGFLQLIAAIWIWSSLTEEVFTRGLLFAWLASTEARAVPPTARIATSALLFGAMHLTLLVHGTDPWTLLIVLTATTSLGILCGIARERSQSLLPAIMVHALYNVGGFVGGVIPVLAGLVPAPT